MKPALLLTLCLAVCTTGSSQLATVDPVAGFGVSHLFAKDGSPRATIFGAEDIGYAWRAGLGLSYRLDDRTSLSTGARYEYLSSRQVRTSGDLRWGSQWNGTEFDPSLPGGELVGTITNTERVNLVEIPLEVRRALNDKANHFYVQGGVVPSVLLGVKARMQANGVDFESTTDRFGNFWLAATAGVGYQWQCSEGWAIYGQLSGTVQLLEEYSGSQSRRWDGGLITGVRLSL